MNFLKKHIIIFFVIFIFGITVMFCIFRVFYYDKKESFSNHKKLKISQKLKSFKTEIEDECAIQSKLQIISTKSEKSKNMLSQKNDDENLLLNNIFKEENIEIVPTKEKLKNQNISKNEQIHKLKIKRQNKITQLQTQGKTIYHDPEINKIENEIKRLEN